MISPALNIDAMIRDIIRLPMFAVLFYSARYTVKVMTASRLAEQEAQLCALQQAHIWTRASRDPLTACRYVSMRAANN